MIQSRMCNQPSVIRKKGAAVMTQKAIRRPVVPKALVAARSRRAIIETGDGSQRAISEKLVPHINVGTKFYSELT